MIEILQIGTIGKEMVGLIKNDLGNLEKFSQVNAPNSFLNG